MEPEAFSFYNKVEIYAGYLAIMVVGFPLYPEISKEMWFMIFSFSEGRELSYSHAPYETLGNSLAQRGTNIYLNY